MWENIAKQDCTEIGCKDVKWKEIAWVFIKGYSPVSSSDCIPKNG